MKIRNLVSKDMPDLAALYNQFWNKNVSNIPAMKKAFKKLSNRADYIFLGAEDNGRLIGSVMGIVCAGLYGECLPFLTAEDMIVDKAFRRKGVGGKLMRELEKRGKAKNCRYMILVTEAGRNDARAFYPSCGFDPSASKGFKKKI